MIIIFQDGTKAVWPPTPPALLPEGATENNDLLTPLSRGQGKFPVKIIDVNPSGLTVERMAMLNVKEERDGLALTVNLKFLGDEQHTWSAV